MDYFELYGLPVSLKPDMAIVKQRFYELSRQYHPDFYAQAGNDEQEAALEKSSMVNKAFKTFSNADATLQYVLMQKGLLQEEEKYTLPPAFLMEMMDLNESLADAKAEGNKAQLAHLCTAIHEIIQTIYAPVQETIEHYQEGVTTQEALLQVKDYYFKKKYLTRMTEGL
jgi:molecular chaperone HscB